MIYTVTLNPSLDYIAACDTLNFGKTNRTNNEYIVPGGKGLNVSILLSRLGRDTTAFGFSGGFTGRELERLLKLEHINCDFEKVLENTRINVKLSNKKITEFNGSGISLDDKKIDALKEKIKLFNSGDWLCLSGSIPKGAKDDIYLQLALCAKDGVNVVVDAVGESLKQSLKAKPFLIKPNIDELCDLFGKQIETLKDIEIYAKKLQEMGARNVLVSMGGDGALLVDENGYAQFQKAPKGNVINTVAAGDSMIAGFIHRYLETANFAETLKFSVACGSATAFSKWLSKPELINELYKSL